MAINAAYIIHAGDWVHAQAAYCTLQQQWYDGPRGEWIKQKADSETIVAVNCDEPAKITPLEFALLQRLLTKSNKAVKPLEHALSPLPRFGTINLA